MSHVFDLSAQHSDVDSKIVAGLERIGRALTAQLWEHAKAKGLSPIQAQFLIYLKHHHERDRRVGTIAKTFGLTHATVSDAISTLQEKGYVARHRSHEDRRVTVLALTSQGKETASALEGWADGIKRLIAPMDARSKGQAFHFVMDVIQALQRAGVISLARTCRTCRYFRPNRHNGSRPHHCRLLDQPLGDSHLRIDCPDHTPAESSG